MRVATRRLRAVARDLRAVLPDGAVQAAAARGQGARRRARRAPRPRRPARPARDARGGAARRPTRRASRRSPARCARSRSAATRRSRRRWSTPSAPICRASGTARRERGRARGGRGARGGARSGRARRGAVGPQRGVRGMKARKVKGLDPEGTLADNAERIVARAPRRAAVVHPARRSTPPRSRRCTTCGSPPSGCATSSSSRPSRASARTPRRRSSARRSSRTCSARSTTATCSCRGYGAHGGAARRRRADRPDARARRGADDLDPKYATRTSRRARLARPRDAGDLPARRGASCCSSASSSCGRASSATASARG